MSYGETMLAAKLGDAAVVARTTGVSLGKAKAEVGTGNSLKSANEVRGAFKSGELSLDQAAEIATAENAPQAIDRALEAGPGGVLPDAQREVEKARPRGRAAPGPGRAPAPGSYRDELGMISINLLLEAHVGAPLVNRAEAGRLFRSAQEGRPLGALRALPRRRLRLFALL